MRVNPGEPAGELQPGPGERHKAGLQSGPQIRRPSKHLDQSVSTHMPASGQIAAHRDAARLYRSYHLWRRYLGDERLPTDRAVQPDTSPILATAGQGRRVLADSMKIFCPGNHQS